jgi:hypothetical protein
MASLASEPSRAFFNGTRRPQTRKSWHEEKHRKTRRVRRTKSLTESPEGFQMFPIRPRSEAKNGRQSKVWKETVYASDRR